MDLMCAGAKNNHIGGAEPEKKSWEVNAAKLYSLLRLSRLPNDIEIAFEYKCPLSGRIDCMLFGYGKDNKKHILHIEMKQWSNNSVKEVFETGVFQVSALVGGGFRMLSHPSQQAYNYQKNILNYVSYADSCESKLNGYAYCYNYKFGEKPNVLYADHYKPVIEKCPLNSGDQAETFARVLKDLLSGGKGADIFKEFISCPIKPTKNLINAAANFFTGQEDYVLLDDQLTSSNIIFGMIEKVLDNPTKKMALIVKGGPGTGKTVIALKVIAELAKSYPKLNAFYTTRSKALRNTLREKLRSINVPSKTGADGLIRNIFDFRPANFSEGQVDVLLIDETHRIQRSSNYMADRGMVQTYLTQVISLLYCAKVCVFFIDDHQGVKSSEIGLSSSIEVAAQNYTTRIKRETDAFKDEIKKAKEQAYKLEVKIDQLRQQNENGKLSNGDYLKALTVLEGKLTNRKKMPKKLLDKEYQLDDVKSNVKEVDIQVMELTSQFRCNGSDNYLDWLDVVLYDNQDTVERKNCHFGEDYYFKVCGTPKELEAKIRSLNMPKDNSKQIARLVAGYCWTWSDKLQPNGDLYKDVKIGDWEMPWETNNIQARPPYYQKYAPSADLWASHPMGINQVGCIFSAQGFEVDYIGVILGPDIRFDETSGCVVAVKGHTHSVEDSDPDFDEHIKNIYRVLLSRGRKGCLIYCFDQALSEYMKKFDTSISYTKAMQ